MYQNKGKKRGTISNIAVGGTDRRARVRDQNLEKGQGKGSWDRGSSCFKVYQNIEHKLNAGSNCYMTSPIRIYGKVQWKNWTVVGAVQKLFI